MKVLTAIEILDETIAELEARLNLWPGEELPRRSNHDNNKEPTAKSEPDDSAETQQKSKNQEKPKAASSKGSGAGPNCGGKNIKEDQQPEICKLEFKVGVITRVWEHPGADKLYCEEIDVGEATGPRQIASGLRPHFTLEQMMGQRLLVVTNLKAKNLVGFKSHGMVLCATIPTPDGGGGDERVEFVEPPEGAPIGEVVTFEGLPDPRPLSAAQVDKKKVFQKCLPGMSTNDDCIAVWDGRYAFLTSAGPCKVKSAAGACLR
jgi:aminoacyl tRNA synthase complex-interacting multifunctional protein 1